MNYALIEPSRPPSEQLAMLSADGGIHVYRVIDMRSPICRASIAVPAAIAVNRDRKVGFVDLCRFRVSRRIERDSILLYAAWIEYCIVYAMNKVVAFFKDPLNIY